MTHPDTPRPPMSAEVERAIDAILQELRWVPYAKAWHALAPFFCGRSP